MKNFSYIGINSQGKSINGNLLSKNKKEALFILNKKGIIVEKLFSKSNYLTKFNIFSDGFEVFVKSLHNLISTGIPLTDALNFISSGQAGSSIQDAGVIIFENVKNGIALHKSIRDYFPNASNFHLSLISSGEKSGNIEEALYSVSHLIDEDKTKKSELISSLTYPLILLITMFALIFFILEYALPKMLGVMDLNNQMPIATSILIISGEILPSIIVGCFYIVLIFSILIVLRNRLLFLQNFLDIFFIKIPFAKNLIFILSRRTILQVYSIGLNGGLTIQETTSLVIESISNNKIKKSLILLKENIESGERFSHAIEKTNILNSYQIASIKIGDETDNLKENFHLLKNQFEAKISFYLRTISKIIEPTILIIFGIIILILALGIILPVLESTNMVM